MTRFWRGSFTETTRSRNHPFRITPCHFRCQNNSSHFTTPQRILSTQECTETNLTSMSQHREALRSWQRSRRQKSVGILVSPVCVRWPHSCRSLEFSLHVLRKVGFLLIITLRNEVKYRGQATLSKVEKSSGELVGWGAGDFARLGKISSIVDWTCRRPGYLLSPLNTAFVFSLLSTEFASNLWHRTLTFWLAQQRSRRNSSFGWLLSELGENEKHSFLDTNNPE